MDYAEFHLNLTEVEVQVRLENGRTRRQQEAKSPMLKPLEMFDFEATPNLDARLIKEFSTGEFIKKAFGDWAQIFRDPNLTAALLDRVTHKAHIINCNWESHRRKEKLRKRD